MRSLALALAFIGGTAGAAIAPPSVATRAIPKLDAIVIDGDGAEWGTRGLGVDAFVPVSEALPSPKSAAASARVGWDERGLLLYVSVDDNHVEQAAESGPPWDKDSVEIFVATGRAERDIYQVAVRAESGTFRIEDHRKARELRERPIDVEVKAKRSATGYVVEARLPWANLGITPKEGGSAALQIVVNDVDRGGPRSQLMWYPEAGAYEDSAKMIPIRLARAAGPTEKVTVAVDPARFPRLRVRVAAAQPLAGKAVTVRAGAISVRATLDEDARAVVVLPPLDKAPASIDVAVAGARPVSALPTDFAKLTKDALARQRVVCERAVFWNDAFPPCEFEHPTVVEDLVGPYRATAEYYDGAYRKVDKPAGPGRYGAIVTIKTADGRYLPKRFVTLYRTAESIPWRRYALPFEPVLPQELGVSAVALRENKGMVHDFVRDALADAFGQRANAATLLAGLRESSPGQAPTQRNSPGYKDQLYWYELKHRTGDYASYAYLVDLPKAYEADASKRWPLVVFLHGSGERGDDLAVVQKHGPPMRAATGALFPFVLVSLQCPMGDRWLPRAVMDVVNEAEARFRIDKTRVYLTGLSMGGYGTWATATEYPREFAAIAPVCGGGDPLEAPRLKGVPAWVFHGKKDESVPIQKSVDMVDALKKLGADVTFTVYPEAGHDSWTETYDNPKLYEWLLSHQRGATK